MPIHRAGMLEAPVNRNPTRPPGLHANLFRPGGVPPNLKEVEVLAGEKVPVPFQKRFPQLFRERLERLAVIQVVGVDRIVGNPRAYEVVVTRIVLFRPLESRRRRFVHPQRLDPSVADIARVRRARHARKRSWNGTAVAGGQELPLLQREMRQLVDSDEQKLRALILVNVILVAAVAEPRRRSVFPCNNVFRFVEGAVPRRRHIPPELRYQRRLQFGEGPAQQQRVASVMQERLADRFPQERLCLAGPRGAAKQAVFRGRVVELLLARERFVGFLRLALYSFLLPLRFQTLRYVHRLARIFLCSSAHSACALVPHLFALVCTLRWHSHSWLRALSSAQTLTLRATSFRRRTRRSRRSMQQRLPSDAG